MEYGNIYGSYKTIKALLRIILILLNLSFNLKI